jgi:hypothetical protein
MRRLTEHSIEAPHRLTNAPHQTTPTPFEASRWFYICISTAEMKFGQLLSIRHSHHEAVGVAELA